MTNKKIAHQGKAQAGRNDKSHDNAAAIEPRADGEALFDLGTLIAEIQKNSRERLRITVGQYKGHEYVGIRVWYVGIDGQYRPSKSGVTLRPALLPGLMQALCLAARAVDPTGAR